MLLNFGANPRLTTGNGESALTLACMQENSDICERLIIAKANVNELDLHQRTPLLKAARHNSNSKILELLLKHHAKPDIADEEGNTPLHFAAQRGTKDLAKFLLDLGANPYMRNSQGFVPYEMCTDDSVKEHFCVCPVCKKTATLACQGCNIVKYCDVECQKKDYLPHKKLCKLFQTRGTKNK